MGATSLVARVRALLERAAQGPLDPSELASAAQDLAELRSRLERLRSLGYEDAASLSPEVEALAAQLTPAAAAA